MVISINQSLESTFCLVFNRTRNLHAEPNFTHFEVWSTELTKLFGILGETVDAESNVRSFPFLIVVSKYFQKVDPVRLFRSARLLGNLE